VFFVRSRLVTRGTLVMPLILKALDLFLLAGFCELGGGYLGWWWLQSSRPGIGYWGHCCCYLYGAETTSQPTSFGKTDAVYGALLIVMSIAWAWYFNRFRPDLWDVAGGFIILAGVGITLGWPRS
jgi:small multidrug resistance family-3 protein